MKETFDPSRNNSVVITVGQFRTAREFPIVDLTRVPSVPSIFDLAMRDSRSDIIFLNRFMHDFQEPVIKDGREHIDYVPTQIVTEYIRHMYSHPDYGVVRGVLYRSVRGEGECCVLFFDNEQCCNIEKGWTETKEQYSQDKPRFWLGLDCEKIHRVVPSHSDS